MNIGIFDSGIGGMTLLHQAMVLMPHENYIFYADTDHVPYGTKTREQVMSYVDAVIRFMTEHDCKAVLIACNTATAVAADRMRTKYQSIPIIGIEPAVKPAFVWEWVAICAAYLKALAVCNVLQRVSFAPVARLAFIAGFASWIVVLLAFVAITIESRKRD